MSNSSDHIDADHESQSDSNDLISQFFSEQGTGASHQAAAKFLDAIARLPGNDGEEADAVGAYTQAWLGGPDPVAQEKCPETWITLPKHQWPAEWHGVYEKPVVRLRKALYLSLIHI